MRYKIGGKVGSSIAVICFVALMAVTIFGGGTDELKSIVLAIYGTGLLLVLAFT